MVSRTYLEHKPATGPKGLDAIVDQEVLPAAANAAFNFELWIDDMMESVRENPLTAMAAAIVGTWLLTRLFTARR